MSMLKRTWCVLAACVLGASASYSDVKLPAVISDNMVLQKTSKAPIWGWASPGEKVTVQLNDQKASTTADDKGAWRVVLDTSKQAATPCELVVTANNVLTVTNVLVGEVWLASGQSNMEFTVTRGQDAKAEIAAADYPQIRQFHAAYRKATEPQADTTGRWDVCSPKTAASFTAVGYFFARTLNQELKVPVGLVHTSWGGTPAEAWTSAEGLSYDERFKAAIARNIASPTKTTTAPGINQNSPTVLYNAMIHPLVPYAIAGAIWYQGEANAGQAYAYRTLFPAMITDWRSKWGQGDFPFYFVQLANFNPAQPQPGESDWAELREAQQMTLKLPNTGTAVIIDIGDAKDIHPKNKQEVGRRLALNALAKTYGKKIEYSGPMYESMKVEGGKVRLTFSHTTGGMLTEMPMFNRADTPVPALKGFAICGADHKFVWADAKIDGDTVVVSSADVAEPVAVRYAWANNPVCNLYNGAGLPASPFRRDDYPGITAPKPAATAPVAPAK